MQLVSSVNMPVENGKRSVRILLIGDPGVGKTSLIYALVSEEFPDEVPAHAEEITIPPDVTPERVATQIVDYSSELLQLKNATFKCHTTKAVVFETAQDQSPDNLVQELHKANVICIVYSVEDDATIDKITNYWLPLIRDNLGEEHNVPVVLVGNKIDLVEYSSLDVVLPIMNQYNEVETCVECSAKSMKNISELFYYAQKAVLHPIAPLYSPENRDLTENCKKALTRIFRICDLDNDGVLNDYELNKFQRRCFNTPLQPQALEDVKNIVKRNVPDGVFDEGLTLTGFLFLHTLFIQRGRHETTWTVLRKFGYDDKVTLDHNYLHPPLEVPSGSSTELTVQGYQFLTQIFEKYDKDCDGALSPSEVQSLFQIFDKVPQWANILKQQQISDVVPTNENGWITLHGFLSLWTLITRIDVQHMFECLAYLGYLVSSEENQLSAVYITRDKRLDLQKRQTSRNVFLCHVIGPKGAGKTSFIRSFLEKTHCQQQNKHVDVNSILLSYAVNKIQVYGQQKYLIMREIDINNSNDLTEPELICDVACLMFDASDPNSFEFIARIFLKYFVDCKLPVLIIAAKSDEPVAHQQCLWQPEEFCAKYKLPAPHPFSILKDDQASKEVYFKLATIAAYPNLKRLVHVLLNHPTQSWVPQQFRNLLPNDASSWLRTGVGIATLALISIFVMKLMNTK